MLKPFEIEQIEQLCKCVSALVHVAHSDKASEALLRQIENLVADPVPSKLERTPIEQRITSAKEASARGLYGLLSELAKDQDSTLGELNSVAQAMGYKSVAVFPF